MLKALKAEVYEKYLTAGLRCQIDVTHCLGDNWSLVGLTPAFIETSPSESNEGRLPTMTNQSHVHHYGAEVGALHACW